MPYDKSIIIFITTFKSIHVICDWLWEKGQFQAFLQNRVIGTAGQSRLLHHSFCHQSNALRSYGREHSSIFVY